MKRKRLNFTLLEVLIALALAGALFTALFSYFRQSTENNIKAQQLKRTILPLELLHQRLTQIFANLSKSEFQTLTSTDALGNALYFKFDYGVDPDPEFCGEVEAMLYLSPQKQLCLATWGHSDG